MTTTRSTGSRRRVVVGTVAVAVVVLAVIALGGYWFVLRSDDKAQPTIAMTPVAASGPLDGTWTVLPSVGTGDEAATWVGYRVDETLAGIPRTDVGRSSAVTGMARIDGTTVSSIAATADLSTLATDNAQRDASVRNVLDANDHPDATFTSTAPVQLPAPPGAGSLVTVSVTGDLTLHGVTRSVTVPLQARWDGTHVQVVGQIPIVMADYGIQIPEIPGLVKAEDHGTLEVQLFLERRP